MTIAGITRDEARELARERLPEILADVVPGFRPERAFRCLNPSHEDRHPSMRYLSRSKTVKCFSCDWSGDVFNVVGAVYGLTGGDVFRKVYDLLGINVKAGTARRQKQAKQAAPKAEPGSWTEIVNLIYPPGWDAVEEVEPPLPLPLEVTANAEAGIVGLLLLHPGAVEVCIKSGLDRRHFDDVELGETYADICAGAGMDEYNPDFFAWLEKLAAPAHMARRLARFIVAEGQRRKLEAAFSMAYSSLQNQEPPGMVLEDVLNQAELALDCRFDVPEQTDTAMCETVAGVFQRFHDAADVLQIVERFRRIDKAGAII